jgi:hypothetical protein
MNLMDQYPKMKVFGIGFHKTGTSSLGEALRLLGFTPVANFTPEILPAIRASDFESVRKFCESYQAFEDNPWPLIYRELDEMFPGSKFVLTLRPTDSWLRSLTKHFGGATTEMRQWIYGADHGDPLGSEEIYRARYEAHRTEVLEYFSKRPNDLAVMDWTEGAGWPELCRVLGSSVPDLPFPHTNMAQTRSLYGRIMLKLGLVARSKA